MHSGLTLAANSFSLNARDSLNRQLTFQADPDAPLGENTLALDQWDFTRTGLLLPINIVPVPPPSGPGLDDSIQWSQASGSAVAINKDQAIWHSGHVNAILPLGNASLLVGADSGGVWTVASNGVALPLSNDWDNPDITCLAAGPDGPNHFYAGAAANGAVYVSEPDTAFLGFIKWHPVPLVDSAGTLLDTGAVLCMLVTKQNRKLVVGCGKGVFWADIPALGQPHFFSQATFLPAMGFSGVALGPFDTVAAAGYSDGTAPTVFFFGSWTGGALQFQPATINGPLDVSKMRRTSVSSCDSQPMNMYAVTAAPDESILAVLRSQDGGQTWQPLKTTVQGKSIGLEAPPPDAPAGLQGEYNNCIAVCPSNPSLVVIGWRNGPWFSQDSGSTWNLPRNDSIYRQLHSDLLAIAFEPADPSGKTVYVGNDGGVMVTRDLGANFADEYNQRLQTLQFQGWGRDSYGIFTPNRRAPGVVGGGLQGNGNVYAAFDSGSDEYRQLEASDGQVMLIVETGHVLHFNSEEVNVFTAHRWDGGNFVDGNAVSVRTPGPGTIDRSKGLPRGVSEAVTKPVFRRPDTGQLMYAVACAFSDGDLYGLFADDDGGHMNWDYIGTIPITAKDGQVWSVASLHGDIVFAGTQDGRIFSLNPRGKQPFELVVPVRATDPGQVLRI